MLEQETDTILRTLADGTIGTKEEITLNEALSGNLPRPIKSYLQAEVMEWLRDDLRSAPHFARAFDRTGGLGSLTKAFLRTLAEHYRFTREEYLGILENGVHFVENYLCRPRWTLDNFILENQQEVSPETVTIKLGYLSDYAYFRELLERFAHGREGKLIAADELRSVIATIDDQVVKQHSARELALLTKPIFEFLLLHEEPAEGTIPAAALLVFFEDKKMSILKEYVESICHIRNQSALSLEQLSSLIEDLRLGVSPPPPEPSEPLAAAPPAEQEPVPEQHPVEEPAPEPPETGRHPASPTEWEGFSQVLPPVETTPPETRQPEPPQPVSFEAEKPTPAPEEAPQPSEPVPELSLHAGPPASEEVPGVPEPVEDLFPPTQPGPPEPLPSLPQDAPEPPSREKQNIPLSLTFAGLKGPAQEQHAHPDLNRIIPDDLRERFLKKIFRRDAKYYAGVISALNKTRSWKEASMYLNRLYQVNKFDPFQKEIVEFTDAVQKRFIAPGAKHP